MAQGNMLFSCGATHTTPRPANATSYPTGNLHGKFFLLIFYLPNTLYRGNIGRQQLTEQVTSKKLVNKTEWKNREIVLHDPFSQPSSHWSPNSVHFLFWTHSESPDVIKIHVEGFSGDRKGRQQTRGKTLMNQTHYYLNR